MRNVHKTSERTPWRWQWQRDFIGNVHLPSKGEMDGRGNVHLPSKGEMGGRPKTRRESKRGSGLLT